MVVMYKWTPEKREKWVRKLDKMVDTIEELKECLEGSDEFDDEDWEDEEPQFKVAMRKAMKTAVKNRYSKKGLGY